MTQNALGLIETIGYTAAIEAADTCLKSANVKVIGYEKVTSGFVTVKIYGDVGAVKAAIDAAKISAGKINSVLSTLIIPRPNNGIHTLIHSNETVTSVDVECKKVEVSNDENTTNQIEVKSEMKETQINEEISGLIEENLSNIDVNITQDDDRKTEETNDAE